MPVIAGTGSNTQRQYHILGSLEVRQTKRMNKRICAKIANLREEREGEVGGEGGRQLVLERRIVYSAHRGQKKGHKTLLEQLPHTMIFFVENKIPPYVKFKLGIIQRYQGAPTYALTESIYRSLGYK